MGYQETIRAVSPIRKSEYDISIFGDADGDGYPSRCQINFWQAAGCTSISMRPEDARNLAAHLALAAIVAEHGDAEIIDFTLERAAA